jgi:formylglycine-generating enzyme required for sulfatase activity
MHGNAAEWTLSAYRPYPYRADDGREKVDADARRVVRGGSFADIARWGRSSMRTHYHQWQKVYNVGFRIACAIDAGDRTVSRRERSDKRQ